MVITTNDGLDTFLSFPVVLACTAVILALPCALSLCHYTTLASQAYVSTLLPKMRADGYVLESDAAVACTDLSRLTATATVTTEALALFTHMHSDFLAATPHNALLGKNKEDAY